MRGFRLFAILIGVFSLAACSGSSTPDSFQPGSEISNPQTARLPGEPGPMGAARPMSSTMNSNATKASPGQTFTVLHSFTGGADGTSPYSGLTPDGAGNFYGTDVGNFQGQGYGVGYGTVFKLTQTQSGWSVAPIYTFTGGSDGAYPFSQVVFGPDGNLYGTTWQDGVGSGEYGCCGVVFKLTRPTRSCGVVCPWTQTVLYRFKGAIYDGGYPEGNLTFDRAGNIYGTAGYYGAFGKGTVWELTTGGAISVLYNFGKQNDGFYPLANVVFGPDGGLYGTTYSGGPGGAGGNGTVYELTRSGSTWSEAHVYAFPHGASVHPYSGVLVDATGNVYGSTFGTGQGSGGSLFKIVPSQGWTPTILHTFTGNGGPTNANLVADANGNIYGSATLDGAGFLGTVFELPAGGGYSDLHDFYRTDGELADGSVALDANGNLYGTTWAGGSNGYGVIYEITSSSKHLRKHNK